MRKTLEAREAGSRLNTLLASDIRAEMARSLANAQDSEQGAKLDLAALGSRARRIHSRMARRRFAAMSTRQTS